jgi:hypothetical protein
MKTVTLLVTDAFLRQHGRGDIPVREIGGTALGDIVFRPNDPDAPDEQLKRYYSARLGSESEARQLVDDLKKLPTVEAVWIRPEEGPPE